MLEKEQTKLSAQTALVQARRYVPGPGLLWGGTGTYKVRVHMGAAISCRWAQRSHPQAGYNIPKGPIKPEPVPAPHEAAPTPREAAGSGLPDARLRAAPKAGRTAASQSGSPTQRHAPHHGALSKVDRRWPSRGTPAVDKSQCSLPTSPTAPWSPGRKPRLVAGAPLLGGSGGAPIQDICCFPSQPGTRMSRQPLG